MSALWVSDQAPGAATAVSSMESPSSESVPHPDAISPTTAYW